MSEETGRFYVKHKDKTFCVEPIDTRTRPLEWGDVNPATGKVEGSYGDKYKGSIKEEDSIITEENGFKNITYSGIGGSPMSIIEKLVDESDRG